MFRTVGVCLAVLTAASASAEITKGVAAKNITTVTVHSAALGAERSMNVLLPVDYDSSTSRYPVLYLLHGLGDDQSAWSLFTNLSAYAAGRKLIVAMPDAGRSFYVNSAADAKARFEDFIAKDVVEYMDSHYRTLPLRKARAVAGLSMGGFGAMFLGLKHSDTFSAIGAFSGALAIAHGTSADRLDKDLRDEVKPLFGAPNSAVQKERDPFELVDKVPAGQMPVIYVACGGQDFLLDQNRAFIALVASKKIPYEYREVSPRVHEWDFWDEQIPVFLDVFERRQ
jgi:S-formylglutathione hydrolase FrmB